MTQAAKIVAVRLGMLRAPLRTPFKTALRTVDAIEDLVVLIDSDDGRTGYGAAPATAVITGDTHGSMIAAIRGHIAPRLIGGAVDDLNGLTQRVQSALQHNISAKAAVDIALHDLWAQRHGAPLYQLLGGGTPSLRTDITISVNDPATMVADAGHAVAQGYRALKVKLGLQAEEDIKRVKAIAAAVAGRASLRLDANQGWTPRLAVRVLRTLEDAGVALELV